MRTYYVKILVLGLAVVFADVLSAQVNISGVINQNTPVVDVIQPACSDCDPTCKDTIEVDDASIFQIGDRALIIQMKGASINTANTSSGGQITDIANAGNYEFFIVDSLDLTNNIIYPEYGLVKQYDASGQAQVIRIPNYGSNTVTVNGTLTAPTWQESTGVGGVVALIAKKLVLNANIDVIGKGFKGNQMNVNGTPDNCSVSPTSAFTLASTASQSFTKGEGIVSDNTSYNRGRAPRANGGGSGISGDSGGGGGSSYGAGGIGGKRWCDINGAEAGGLGGVSLSSYFLADKLFLGGAGGSGFVTTSNPSDATDGGGIVILFVDTLVGNGYSILADGTTPVGVNPVGAPDGGGGGGGGGCVLLNVLTITDSLTVTANGGDGQDLNTTNIHGPGGGGGGGVLLYSLPTLPGYVNFSAVGGSPGQHSNGALNGAAGGSTGGTFGLYVPIENVNYRANVDGDDVAPVCDIDDDNDGIPDIQEIYTGDHDSDGVLDWNDPDFCADVFDGVSGWDCSIDGLPNPTADLDGDGYANFIDSDFPYCGSFVLGIDKICSNFDPDGDGIPSHLDLDSDNDGIPDIIEVGGLDTNGDGQADNMVDTDGDGLIDLYDNDDTDGPQGSNPCSPQPGCLDSLSYTILPVSDIDMDTIPDFLDLDSDNDGIPDIIEVGGTDVNGDGRIDNFGDSDDDGYSDVIDALICEDSVDIVNNSNFSNGTYLSASSIGITNGTNTSGAPDGAYGQIYDTGDRLVLDLGQIYPSGTNYILTWRRKASYGSGPTADLVVEESADGSTYSTNSETPQDATQSFINTLMTTETATRYLRIRTLSGSGDDADFDAVTIGDSSTFYNVYEVCFTRVPLIYTGTDANNDGFPESVMTADADADGIYDFFDLDSDNDGIPDVVEAGGTDANGDGRADNYSDTDGDGFNDVVDGDPTNVLVLGDDGSGANTTNALHLSGSDTDNDGHPNTVVSNDPDNDGLPSFIDLDSDGDGITDVLEAGGTDANEDGIIDGSGTDTDDDGWADNVDGDVGNDGTAENTASALLVTGADANADGAPDSYPNANTDGDLQPDLNDIDSDNDGITDHIEGQGTASFAAISGIDTDGDGIDNAYDPDDGGTFIDPVDTDSDGTPDYLDTDSDDDAFPDFIEGHDMNGDGIADASSPANTGLAGIGTDADADGLLDGWDNDTTSADPSNASLTPASHPDIHNPGGDRDWRQKKDTDADGVTDVLDLDDDNDGIPDEDEAAGYDPDGNEDGDELLNWLDVIDDGNGGDGSTTDYTDANGDGIADVYDIDRDGVPNHLDKDTDNDGIVDILEAGGVDVNFDGEVDYPTSGVASSMVDADDDGLADTLDNLDSGSGAGEVTNGTPLPQYNSDAVGNKNFLDIDADGDGIIDNIEAQATTETPLQTSVFDMDVDGISDVFDPDQGGTYLVPIDTDNDGTPDYLDTDSDNDAVSDSIEGWDTDGDGVAETIAVNADTDGDGLDNSFDLVNGLNAVTNPSNNAQDAYDFPDAAGGTYERDWREEPCADSRSGLSLTNQVTTTADYCRSAGWTYYLVHIDSAEILAPGDSSVVLMAIEHHPFGGNTSEFVAEVSLTVSSNPKSEAGLYSQQDVINEDATFVMGRYWNISLLSGSLNGDVNVRLFYDQEEVDTLLAASIRWNQQYAGNTSAVSGLRWFAVTTGSFDPASADLQADGIQGSYQVYPTATGVEDGIEYIEFTTGTLTGGSLGYTIGNYSVILPVELMGFEAQPISAHEVLLSWITVSETNNEHFIVERSKDLIKWSEIGVVAGAGNTSSVHHYSMTDRDALKGHSYYRLRQVDFDGNFTFSEVRDVYFNDEAAQPSIFLYPNPSSDEVYLNVHAEGDQSFEIRNAPGQVIQRFTTHGSESHTIGGLAPGMYFLVNSGNRASEPIRFIITR